VLGFRLLTLFFQQETGTRFALVPYQGRAPMTQDLTAGQIDLAFITPAQLPLARSGSIKAYAVTSETRLSFAPDIPTFGELELPRISYSEWFGLFAPKGTPTEIIDRLNAAAVQALADPAVRAPLAELGSGMFPREQQSPETLGNLVRAGADRWWPNGPTMAAVHCAADRQRPIGIRLIHRSAGRSETWSGCRWLIATSARSVSLAPD
jgi:tripartite-type tricarboxylate transporter receptor subunit TctC